MIGLWGGEFIRRGASEDSHLPSGSNESRADQPCVAILTLQLLLDKAMAADMMGIGSTLWAPATCRANDNRS